MSTPKTIAIVGGGFSGAALTFQLLRRMKAAGGPPQLRIALIEQSAALGLGIAYSTPDPNHLLNVPTVRMSALPDEPDSFLEFARREFDANTTPTSFLPRNLYGRYVQWLLRSALAEAPEGAFQHIQAEATGVRRRSGGLVVQLGDGSTLPADAVVLAVGNFPPAALQVPGLSSHSRHYVASPWGNEALDRLPADGDVLVIGTGLTSVDLAVSLHSRGFRGKLHLLSRHGLLPQRHKTHQPWPADWAAQAPRTARGLLHTVREQVRAATAAGSDWRAVTDGIRPHTGEVWQSLSADERRRFVRHVRATWDVHRHRIAPEIGAVLDEMTARGQLLRHVGHLERYSETPERAVVEYTAKLGGERRRIEANVVINATGPCSNLRQVGDPVLDDLFAQGAVETDDLSLGLRLTPEGAIADSVGNITADLFALGPLRKGMLWESIAVPELRVQAAKLAEHLIVSFARQTPEPALAGRAG